MKSTAYSFRTQQEKRMFQTTNMSYFGKQMRSIRRKCQLSQREVHYKTGISEDALRKIENGYVIPKYETLLLLSRVYNTDLNGIFCKLCQDPEWQNFYSNFNDLAFRNDIEGVHKLLEALEREKKKAVPLLVPQRIDQYAFFLKGAVLNFSKGSDEQIIALLVQSLRVTIPQFKISSFHQHNYSVFELRILLFIALSTCRQEKFKITYDILSFIFTKLYTTPFLDNEASELYAKIIYNISKVNHNRNRHHQCISWAEYGISYCEKQGMLYALPMLYYRKGIAHLFLKTGDHLKPLIQSVYMLHTIGEHALADLYISITKNMYDIDIPDHYSQIRKECISTVEKSLKTS